MLLLLGKNQRIALNIANAHQNLQRPLIKEKTGGCGPNAPAVAKQQRRTDFLLQLLHPLAQRGLGNMQHFRRLGEAAAFHHGAEVFQPFNVHGVSPLFLVVLN